MWGERYGSVMTTPTGQVVHLQRQGQRARWYTDQDYPIGPQQTNVAQAIAYALSHKWKMGDHSTMAKPKSGSKVSKLRKEYADARRKYHAAGNALGKATGKKPRKSK